MDKPKFKITAHYESGRTNSATFNSIAELMCALAITVSDDMFAVEKVVVEKIGSDEYKIEELMNRIFGEKHND